MVKRAWAASVFLAGACVFACQFVAGIEKVDKVPPIVGVDANIPDPCAHALPPPLPENDDDPNAEIPPQYFAFRTLGIQTGDVLNPAGLDLDGVCTCDNRPGTAFDGGESCVATATSCDNEGGIDNKAGSLFSILQLTDTVDINASALRTISQGNRNILLHVSNWNGKANDRDVTVGLLISRGVIDPSGCNSDPNDAGEKKHPPGWCGHDKWTYPPQTTTLDKGVRYPTLKGPAYVNDGTLVFQSEGKVTFFLGNATLSINSPVVKAKMDHNDAGILTLTGVLAGRVEISELLGAVGQFEPSSTDGGDKSPVCKQTIFPFFKQSLCDALDIARTKTFDFKGQRCDAISTALAFTAEAADLGTELDDIGDPGPCDPTLVDPTLYQCPATSDAGP